jgi:hypothetical protein
LISENVKARKKTYSSPSLTQPSREQITAVLVGHAWIGNTGARYLLELFFSEPGPKMAQDQHLPSPAKRLSLVDSIENMAGLLAAASISN